LGRSTKERGHLGIKRPCSEEGKKPRHLLAKKRIECLRKDIGEERDNLHRGKEPARYRERGKSSGKKHGCWTRRRERATIFLKRGSHRRRIVESRRKPATRLSEKEDISEGKDVPCRIERKRELLLQGKFTSQTAKRREGWNA